MIKYFLLFILFMMSYSCGSVDVSRSCALDGRACHDTPAPRETKSCTLTDNGSLITISCPDGTKSSFLKPKDGKDGIESVGPKGDTGSPGKNGSDGYSIVFLITPSLTCAAGGQMVMIASDTNRNNVLDITIDSNLSSYDICNGLSGKDGVDGKNGIDGRDGADGINAPPSAFTPVFVVDPCNDALGIYDEVLLKLSNGSMLASFSDNPSGKNTRFSLLTPGNYQTTDGSKCYFSIDSNMNIFNEHY